MTSIYPKWTGTTSAQLHESRFPRWIGGAIGALVTAVQGIAVARVLPVYTGVATVVGRAGGLVAKTFMGSLQKKPLHDGEVAPSVDIEVSTKGPGV